MRCEQSYWEGGSDCTSTAGAVTQVICEPDKNGSLGCVVTACSESTARGRRAGVRGWNLLGEWSTAALNPTIRALNRFVEAGLLERRILSHTCLTEYQVR